MVSYEISEFILHLMGCFNTDKYCQLITLISDIASPVQLSNYADNIFDRLIVV